jgi:thiamine biosynthesis lipoprotein
MPLPQNVPAETRMFIYRKYIIALLCLGLAACSQGSDVEPPEHKTSLLLFGTIIEITLYDTDAELAESAFTRLESDFSRWHQHWSPWTDGELAQLNQHIAQGKPFQVDTELRAMLQAAADISAKTSTLFNPAIGELINLWQFHRHEEPDIEPPDAAAIRQIVARHPSMADIVINGDIIASTNPAVQLSPGAFAKGYAIEIALNTLQSMGIRNAVINAGGDLKVIGRHGARNWRVGIRHPRKQGVLGWLDVAPGESVFTSGDYERFYMYQGRRMHHILDPRNGYPAKGLRSVTVVHADAGTADAAATALFVAGPEHWYEIARALGIKHVMLVDETGTIQVSPALAERVHFTAGDTASTILSQPL